MNRELPEYATLANLKLIEELYERWLEHPESVDASWQNFFDGMQFASALPKALPPRTESSDLRIHNLIHAYRTYGHLWAQCDPLDTDRAPLPDELKIENFGFSSDEMKTVFPTGKLLKQEKAPLEEILQALQQTYCRTAGIEYMELGSVEMEGWIQKKIEPYFPSHLTDEERIEILKQVCRAEGFETFLHKKYVGQKRFSLEGAETFIPLLRAILDRGAEEGITDALIGMAHRGRLNVLANIMGKSYAYIFEEFEDHYTPDLSESSGDVKYHMGFAGTYASKNGKNVQVILAANPSHLESVNPVVEGGARALQEQKRGSEDPRCVVPILIHGDAAISGQGVVYETMTMEGLNGYGTKGSIHIVINNQIGFTTLPKDGRSTRYCTDIAKGFGAPVLHVNIEDPQMCVAAGRLAIELRQKFGCDVFIDLIGYRKYGHNEGDEPVFTQPVQYQMIRSKKTVREIYRDQLIRENALSQDQADEIEAKFRVDLDTALNSVKAEKKAANGKVKRVRGKDYPELMSPVQTGVDKELLKKLGNKIATVPSGFNLHSKIQRLLNERRAMLEEGSSIDWGTAEMLAYATICYEGIHIRLSGQDARRGTFSHRHGVYVDQVNASRYFPLSHLDENQAPCDIYNSPLSELAVMGFDFGYSLLYPRSLVLWEGQYGDFANGAQVMIDQYLASSEMKWGQTSNLTLLLPHGYEGAGPEHSSARVERYLQLCAEENMTVANCTTPAQFFHLLRRQALRPLKKPLIVFTPKVLLRHPVCRSSLKELCEGKFEEVLDDPSPPAEPNRVLLCSGKFYYELAELRERQKTSDVLIRLEQLYPLHMDKLKKIMDKYTGVKKWIWVQEEHQNMGAWNFLRPYLEELLEGKGTLSYVGREAAASTAAGSQALHKLEHEALIHQLLGQGT